MFSEVKELSGRIGFDLFRVITLIYSVFLFFFAFEATESIEILKRVYYFLNSQAFHTIGIISTLLTLVSTLRTSNSRMLFWRKMKLLFKRESGEGELSDLKSLVLREKEVQKELSQFVKDANDMYIFGGNMDFLNDNYPISNNQFEEILNFGANCKILISEDYKISINKLKKITEGGVKVKIYPEEKANYSVRGRLKQNDFGISANLFLKKGNGYVFQNIESQYISNLLFGEFLDMYSNGKNPFIKYILFDIGGVWCEGKMITFFEKVKEATGETIEDKPENYLLLSEKLNRGGDYTILNYIEDKIKRRLSINEGKNIRKAWNENWLLNPLMKQLALKLEINGYRIIIHSNCDEDNGNKFQLKNYFNGFDLFLSYKMNLVKPNPEFYNYILNNLNCNPFECLFIDDSLPNIKQARKLGFNTIKVSIFSSPEEKVELIEQKMEEMSIKIE